MTKRNLPDLRNVFNPNSDRMNAVYAEMAAINAKRNLTTADEERFDALTGEFDRLHAEGIRQGLIDGRVKLDIPADAEPKADRDEGRRNSQLRGEARRAVDRAARDPHSGRLNESAFDAVHSWIGEDSTPDSAMSKWAILSSDANYRSAFLKVLAAGPVAGMAELSNEERQAFGRMSEFSRTGLGISNTGAYVVPFQLDPSILNFSTADRDGGNVVRKRARNVTIASSAWHGVSSSSVVAGYRAEFAELADATPVLAQPVINIETGASFVQYSIEAEQDSVDLVGQLTNVLMDGKSEAESLKFWAGAGHASNEPLGIDTWATATAGAKIAPTVDNTYTLPDPYKLQESLAAPYQAGATFMASLRVSNLTRRFAETVTGQGAYWSDLGPGVPPTLLGHAFDVNAQMSGTIADTARPLFYGDFSKGWVVVDRVGSTIELVPQILGTNRRPTLQRGAILDWRNSAGVVDPSAIKCLSL